MSTLKIIFFFILSIPLSVCSEQSPKLRSYDEMAEDLWTDHVQHFKKLFELKKMDSMIEFGLGEGTKYFLDHCKEVTSVELLSERNEKEANEEYKKSLKLFSRYSNWNPILYKCNAEMSLAEKIAEKEHINPADIDPTYLEGIKFICEDLFSEKSYDIAFVDGRFLVRGDIVNELFDRVDIIAAHDISHHPRVYGWEWIKTPEDFEKIEFTEGSGTAFWIKKEHKEIIEGLKGKGEL